MAANDSAMGTAGAGTGPAGTTATGAMADPQILAQMSVANGAEIAAGQLAQPKARNQQVKDYARDMIAEHQAMQAQADSLVTRANITPQASQPDTLQRKLDEARTQLQNQAAGADFDRMYMDMQVRDHEGTLALLNASRGAAQNAELRTLIDNAIPKVQQHLDRARQIRGTLGGS
jgi:putative membrane protein